MQEELCCLKPMYGTTNGEDILKTFTDYFEDRGINIRKVFAVITDGAPAMVGKNKGFTKMVEDKIGHPVLKLHCILHQENLCRDLELGSQHGYDSVTKIMNFLVAHSSLTHKQFQAFLEEVDSAYKDILFYSNVRWLSCGKVLERFVECLNEIKIFK